MAPMHYSSEVPVGSNSVELSLMFFNITFIIFDLELSKMEKGRPTFLRTVTFARVKGCFVLLFPKAKIRRQEPNTRSSKFPEDKTSLVIAVQMLQHLNIC